MKKQATTIGIFYILIIILFSSCKEETAEERIAKLGITYFSVNQYIYDQWTNYKDVPFTILKTENINGKIDSSYTNSEKLDWVPIIKIFFETDIGDVEMLGHYKFSQYEDKEDKTVNFYYEANESYLFTRKLLISADPFTSHIKAIYIETQNHSMIFGDTKQKLYYAPLKTIQIQKYEKPLFSDKKSTITQYYLMH